MTQFSLELVDNQFVLNLHDSKLRFPDKLMLEAIGGDFSDDGIVKFLLDGSSSDEVNLQYDEIKRVLDKIGTDFRAIGAAEEALEIRLREDARFKKFSTEAFNIRNNLGVADGLREFSETIAPLMIRKPYEKQLLSAYHLAFAQNACNFSVPGTGKTTVVYASYCYLNSKKTDLNRFVDKLLIICPPAAFGPWEDEYKKCFGRKPSIKQLINLSAEERQRHYEGFSPAEITMISFQSAANDRDGISYFLRDNPNTMVVIDEAHNIKNTSADAKWSNAILSLAVEAKARVCLTGTPAPNDPSDLWNLYKFIWPKKKIISFPLGYLANLELERDKAQLVEEISPFFVRVKKSDLGLPKPEHKAPVMVGMDDVQQEIYDYICGPTIDGVENQLNELEDYDILRDAKLIRLMQCASNPHLLKKPIYQPLNYSGVPGLTDGNIIELALSYSRVPPKFYKTLQLVKEITANPGPSGRVIIWSIFVDNIKMLTEYLADNGIASMQLFGEVPTGNDDTDEHIITRQRIVREFHEETCSYKVLIANPAAVGESISLHKACHNAIYFEKDFNAARFMQSKDRIHRYGLNPGDKITYFSLLSENSIDLDIHDRVLEKERIMLEIIEKEEIPLFSADFFEDENAKDLKAVLRGYNARNFG